MSKEAVQCFIAFSGKNLKFSALLGEIRANADGILVSEMPYKVLIEDEKILYLSRKLHDFNHKQNISQVPAINGSTKVRAVYCGVQETTTPA